MPATILLIGTLDTKGVEIGYTRDRLRQLGAAPLVLDSGILGEPLHITADISREAVALAAGHTIDELRAAGTRGAAVEKMKEGVKSVALSLLRQGRLDGVLCLGGAEGSVMGSTAMRALPLGVPKIIVTPIASGKRQFGTLIGTGDIMVMHSVVDILGINPISRVVYDNAAAAVYGMAAHGSRFKPDPDGQYVAITMLGNTTKAVMHIRDLLKEHGYESAIFHSNGVGGPAMEEFAEQGTFVGVIDYTTDELSDSLVGGFHDAPPDRLERVGAMGLPQVVVPGCVDFTVNGPRDAVPERLRGRPAYYHNPEFTLVRLLKDEQVEVGRRMAQKLNKAKGPVAVVVPTQGLSIPNVPGGAFWDPEIDAAFCDELQRGLKKEIPFIPIDAHINDPVFSGRVAEEFLKLVISK
jgi:uncharacterized protein (UPF0261 family)